MALTAAGWGNPSRHYLAIFDGQGEVVWYRKPPRGEVRSNFVPEPNFERYFYNLGNANYPIGTVELDQNFTAIDTIPRVNPFDGNLTLDGHEVFYDEDGNLWTLWRGGIVTDMSDIIDGGNPEALVNHHFIQQWNPEGDLIWDWNTYDHLDELGYYDVDDTTWLQEDAFDLYHINSVQLTPTGDVIVSPRRMSVASLIDYETGEYIWHLGGGPANDFELTGDWGDQPLAFWRQHDARMWEDGTVTVYDNGDLHDPPRSYARQYELDLDNMTAELIYLYTDPDDTLYAYRTGGFRFLDDGNRLVSWGGVPPLTGTLLDEEDNILWQMHVPPDTIGVGSTPSTYRVYRKDSIEPTARPMVSEVVDSTNMTIDLYCNWFGHEDEVAAYQVFFGTDWYPPLHGITETGIYTVESYEPNTGYVVLIRALDEDGNVISDYSERVRIFLNYLSAPEAAPAAGTPRTFTLAPVYPNPFNAGARVDLVLPRPERIEVQVFDVLGRAVETVHAGRLPAGAHTLHVDAGGWASGVYFLRAKDEHGTGVIRRITLVK